MLLFVLFHGGGGGSKLRLGVGKLSSGLTVARVGELSSPTIGGCNGGEGGSVSEREGRTVESEEPNEVVEAEEEAQPLPFSVAEVVSVVKMLLFCSSAFGVEASGVAVELATTPKNALVF